MVLLCFAREAKEVVVLSNVLKMKGGGSFGSDSLHETRDSSLAQPFILSWVVSARPCRETAGLGFEMCFCFSKPLSYPNSSMSQTGSKEPELSQRGLKAKSHKVQN